MKTIVYDIEIKRAILGKRDSPVDGIEYCAGWHDHANMGISCIGAYDYAEQRFRLFMDDNIAAFAELVARSDLIVSFNGLGFDNRVCAAHGIAVPDDKTYDLLAEMWLADGLGLKFQYATHAGYSLDATSMANFGANKSGHGALAPVQFQRREYGALIDYCLNDVALTKRLFDKVLSAGELCHPKNIGAVLKMRRPE